MSNGQWSMMGEGEHSERHVMWEGFVISTPFPHSARPGRVIEGKLHVLALSLSFSQTAGGQTFTVTSMPVHMEFGRAANFSSKIAVKFRNFSEFSWVSVISKCPSSPPIYPPVHGRVDGRQSRPWPLIKILMEINRIIQCKQNTIIRSHTR